MFDPLRFVLPATLLLPTIGLAQVPTVVSTAPISNELNVDVGGNLSASFDIAMDPATLTNGSIVVSASNTGIHPATFTYEAGSNTATIDPTDDFIVGEAVTVVLTGGVTSATGTPITGYVWSFIVEAGPAPATFPELDSYPAGFITSVVSADFDADGSLDLATISSGGPTSFLSIYLNDGSGFFTLTVPQESMEGTIGPVVATDLEGDGDIDLIGAASNMLFTLLNNGDGTFAPEVEHPMTFGVVFNMSVGDVDADGDEDVVLGNFGGVTVVPNHADGSFGTPVPYSGTAGSEVFDVVTTDVDGDGALDLVSTDVNSNVVAVRINDGAGGFGPRVTYPVGTEPAGLFAADLTGDGLVDLAIANRVSNDVTVLSNNGDGTFLLFATWPVGPGPEALTAADLDGDGDLDLAVANTDFGAPSADMSVMLNSGGGIFGTPMNTEVGRSPLAIIAADLDGDGDLDIAVANRSSSDIAVLMNEGAVFTPPSETDIEFSILSTSDVIGRTMTVEFRLPSATELRADVLSVGGQRVRSLSVGAVLSAGEHILKWDGADNAGTRLAPGVYFVRLHTPASTRVTKAILLR